MDLLSRDILGGDDNVAAYLFRDAAISDFVPSELLSATALRFPVVFEVFYRVGATTKKPGHFC